MLARIRRNGGLWLKCYLTSCARGRATAVASRANAMPKANRPRWTFFREIAEAHGLKCSFDRAANLLVTLPDDNGKQPAIILGSHADSVPQGGNFDGGAGVVAGLICLIRLKAERLAGGPPVRLLILRGEESAYYGRANIGSRALFGLLLPSRSRSKTAGRRADTARSAAKRRSRSRGDSGRQGSIPAGLRRPPILNSTSNKGP